MKFFYATLLTLVLGMSLTTFAPAAHADCIADPGDPGSYFDENGNSCTPPDIGSAKGRTLSDPNGNVNYTDYKSCVADGQPADLCAQTFPDTAPASAKTVTSTGSVTGPSGSPQLSPAGTVTGPSGFPTLNPNLGGTKNQGPNVTLINPLQGGGTLQGFLISILDFVIRIGTIVVILMLVFVGYKFVAAQGEPGAISEARSMLMWTVVGALILLGSKAIAVGIQATVDAISAGN